MVSLPDFCKKLRTRKIRFLLTSPSTLSWQPKLFPTRVVPSSRWSLARAVGGSASPLDWVANNLCWAVDARALAADAGTKVAAEEDADAADNFVAAERDDRRMGRSILVMIDGSRFGGLYHYC